MTRLKLQTSPDPRLAYLYTNLSPDEMRIIEVKCRHRLFPNPDPRQLIPLADALKSLRPKCPRSGYPVCLAIDPKAAGLMRVIRDAMQKSPY